MDTTTEEFGVRSVIPIKRHKKMVKFFKELPAGDSFFFYGSTGKFVGKSM